MLKDFLCFRRMVAPALIQALWWLGTLGCIAAGVIAMTRVGQYGAAAALAGAGLLVAGPLVVRLCCEFLILFFRVNETLTDVKNLLDSLRQEEGPETGQGSP